MSASEIEWTNATWNPVVGCTILSPGCTNCYAMRIASRLEAMGMEKYRGSTRRSGKRPVWSGVVRCHEGGIETPLSWKRPRRIFVNSMSDLFHEQVPVSFISRVWRVMERAHWHTFQILTKRPGRMREILNQENIALLKNVWLGTSVENSQYLFRIDALRAAPAAVRFVSFEPLLGSVAGADLAGIDWTIVGGESGPGARPMDPAWVNEIHDACRFQGVAFFFKQWGGTNKKAAGRRLHGKTWDEYPRSPTTPRITTGASAG